MINFKFPLSPCFPCKRSSRANWCRNDSNTDHTRQRHTIPPPQKCSTYTTNYSSAVSFLFKQNSKWLDNIRCYARMIAIFSNTTPTSDEQQMTSKSRTCKKQRRAGHAISVVANVTYAWHSGVTSYWFKGTEGHPSSSHTTDFNPALTPHISGFPLPPAIHIPY